MAKPVGVGSTLVTTVLVEQVSSLDCKLGANDLSVVPEPLPAFPNVKPRISSTIVQFLSTLAAFLINRNCGSKPRFTSIRVLSESLPV